MVAPAVVTDWITTAEAGKLLCGQTARSVRNHCVIGTRTPAGIVRLRHQRLGGRVYTRPAWVAEYLDAITAAERAGDPPPPPRETPTAEAERFERERAAAAKAFGRRRQQRRK